MYVVCSINYILLIKFNMELFTPLKNFYTDKDPKDMMM